MITERSHINCLLLSKMPSHFVHSFTFTFGISCHYHCWVLYNCQLFARACTSSQMEQFIARSFLARNLPRVYCALECMCELMWHHSICSKIFDIWYIRSERACVLASGFLQLWCGRVCEKPSILPNLWIFIDAEPNASVADVAWCVQCKSTCRGLGLAWATRCHSVKNTQLAY